MRLTATNTMVPAGATCNHWGRGTPSQNDFILTNSHLRATGAQILHGVQVRPDHYCLSTDLVFSHAPY